jgi:hypothetical protein
MNRGSTVTRTARVTALYMRACSGALRRRRERSRRGKAGLTSRQWNQGFARRLRPPPHRPRPRPDRPGARPARVGADALTVAGLAAGLAGAGLVALDRLGAALALVALSRALDGLDGSVARASRPTDRGGFLDITCDFASTGRCRWPSRARPRPRAPRRGAALRLLRERRHLPGLRRASRAKRGLATTGRGPSPSPTRRAWRRARKPSRSSR